ncbi:MAG: short-chain dehydrogenase/reductase [Myxococcaceae bacterium]|nr:short-chain dehydrogenase/reductase [Myxococcaceae bacterium]
MIRYDYAGRVALVTGGSSGIGLATATAFARAGASVVIAARSESAGEAACIELARTGSPAMFVRTDVRDEASVANMVEQTVARFGRLDCAINCAGCGSDMKSLADTDQAAWDGVMAINARGVWLSMRYQVPALLGRGGAIVNMASIYSTVGRAAHHAYVASKHAVLGLTRSVALEYATQNVRVHAITAGITRTAAMRRAEAAVPAVVQRLVDEHPMRRMATEEEIAGAALWLCSDAASYATGSALSIDGGFQAR